MVLMENEFARGVPRPARGLTSIEAVTFLRRGFPQVATWVCWNARHDLVSRIVGPGHMESGAIGEWRWQFVESDYPSLSYIDTLITDRTNWVGLIRVSGPEDATFLIFSYLASNGEVGGRYLVSTPDAGLLRRFSEALSKQYAREGLIHVDVVNGLPLEIPRKSAERLLLPEPLQVDIEMQTYSFFGGRATYSRFGIPYRRGLLLVGPPGCGKTMMVRHLMRECDRRFGIHFVTVAVQAATDSDDIAEAFATAAANGPGMLILEDIDSLTRETRTTRAALLANLDGLATQDGVLVIGTTNNPQDVDPALLDRPSRFDRVWTFELPGEAVRRQYLERMLPRCEAPHMDQLVRGTQGWSFAYLNELRTTAAILTIRDGAEDISGTHVLRAFDMLAPQVRSARRKHATKDPGDPVGFQACAHA